MSLQHRVVRLDNARHYGKVRTLAAVNLIVLHATASGRMQTGRNVIGWMNSQPNPISYHYVIEKDGTMLRMTDPLKIAFHAGVSAWPGKPSGRMSVNARSIGIAFVNDNVAEMLTEPQLESGEWLCRTWMGKLGVGPSAIVAHREVAPGRKTDPVTLPMGAWRRHMERAA